MLPYINTATFSLTFWGYIVELHKKYINIAYLIKMIFP